MIHSRTLLIPLLLAALLSGCAKRIPPAVSQCAGSVERVAGLAPLPHEDGDLLRVAVGLQGEGRLCAAEVLVAERPVEVYRVWDKSKTYSKMGRWWTFHRPAGPLADWQATYAVCPEWGAWDVVSKCQLKVGTKVVVGPGQSMECAKGTFPPSAANQVYIANGLIDDGVYVEKCEPDAEWP